MRRAAAGLLLVVAGLLAVPTAAQAQALTTLVSNGTTTGGDDLFRQQSFETGRNAGGYTLSQIDILLFFTSGRSISVVLREDDNGEPGDLVATHTNPPSLVSPQFNTFTAPNGTILAPRTTYWISLHEGVTSNRLLVGTKSSNAQTGEPGWSIGNDSRARSLPTDSWGSPAERAHGLAQPGIPRQ